MSIKYQVYFDTINMMNGREQQSFLRHWRKKHIKNWHLLLMFSLLLTVGLFSLRHNNLKMVELRNAVVVADENNGDVESALADLNKHVFKHMNTKIVRPIEMVGGYNRSVEAVIRESSNSGHRDIYAEATKVCEKRGIPVASIAQCAANYAMQNNSTKDPAGIKLPDKNLFTYTFASPKWAPDFAGIVLLITSVIGIWIILRAIEYIAVRLIIKSRIKNNFL